VRDLALSINCLADESDRVRAREQERARLQADVHQASVRIREHLRGEAIIREAVTAIHEHLAVDYVQVGIVSGERLTLTESGLGLSIVRTIVANHHGDLSVESAQDHGTTVTVRIPLSGQRPGGRAERDRVRRPVGDHPG
jgi:K+-sensing histidine kinase KdpD